MRKIVTIANPIRCDRNSSAIFGEASNADRRGDETGGQIKAQRVHALD